MNFVNVFICIYWDEHMIVSSIFFIVVYHIDFFEDVEPSLYP